MKIHKLWIRVTSITVIYELVWIQLFSFETSIFPKSNFSNENKGLNKFDSIPVETSDILQAVKNLNFANSANRKESFTEFYQKNWCTTRNAIQSEISFMFLNYTMYLKWIIWSFNAPRSKFWMFFDTNFDRKADFKLFKSMNNSKFNS